MRPYGSPKHDAESATDSLATAAFPERSSIAELFTAPSSRPHSYEIEPERAKEFIDWGVRELRPLLFKLTDKITASGATPSSIIIDDPCARFAGLFIARVLNTERPTPTLCFPMLQTGENSSWEEKAAGAMLDIISQDRSGPGTQITMLTGREQRELTIQSSTALWIDRHRSFIGESPLLVTDAVQTGAQIGVMTRALNNAAIEPDVAVLARRKLSWSTYLSIPFAELNAQLSVAAAFNPPPTRKELHRQRGSEQRLIETSFPAAEEEEREVQVGKVFMGTTIGHDHGIGRFRRAVGTNEALNGVLSARSQSARRLTLPISWTAQAKDQADRSVRVETMRHSRTRLKELVAEYMDSRK